MLTAINCLRVLQWPLLSPESISYSLLLSLKHQLARKAGKHTVDKFPTMLGHLPMFRKQLGRREARVELLCVGVKWGATRHNKLWECLPGDAMLPLKLSPIPQRQHGLWKVVREHDTQMCRMKTRKAIPRLPHWAGCKLSFWVLWHWTWLEPRGGECYLSY